MKFPKRHLSVFPSFEPLLYAFGSIESLKQRIICHFFRLSQKDKITIFSQKILKFDCGCFSGFLFVVVGLGFWFMFYVNYVAHLYVISVTLSFADYQLVFAPLSWPTPKLIAIYVQRKQNNNQTFEEH